jgi:hypothetical protein
VLLQRKIQELILLMVQSEIEGLLETHKDEVMRLVQGRGGTVRWNPHLKPGSPVYDRFIKAGSGLAAPLQPDTTRMVYHGTGTENIEGILQHGMDPSKRKVSTDGNSLLCDWFGTDIDEGHVRSKGGNKRIVFALLVDPRLGNSSGFTARSSSVITGTKGELALPLGVISLDGARI